MRLKNIIISLKSYSTYSLISIFMLVLIFTINILGLFLYSNHLSIEKKPFDLYDNRLSYISINDSDSITYTTKSKSDYNISNIDNTIYTRYSVSYKNILFNDFKVNAKVKSTNSNFVVTGDKCDFYTKHFNLKNNKIIYGSVWTESDIKNLEKKVIIYSSTARYLLGRENAIGEYLNLNKESYEIVGILKDNYDTNTYNRQLNGSEDSYMFTMYIPLYEYHQEYNIDYSIIYSEDSSEIKSIVENDISKDFSVVNKESVMDSVTMKFHSENIIFRGMLFTIGLISTVILFVTILNLLKSKKKDYLLRLAAGSTRIEIYFLILTQNMILYIMSTALSILLSYILLCSISLIIYDVYFPYDISLDYYSLVSFVGISFLLTFTITSIIGYRIVKLNIIESLRKG